MIDKMKSERNFDSIKVSVIVPVYNVEAYLERCLDSLVKQTLEEIEIIVVNDGTKDNSQAIIDRYAAAYPQKVISLIKENGGLSDARNYGIPYAHGEYIGFVDSDDYLNVTMYQKLYDRAAETDSDIVVCGYYGIDENTETLALMYVSPILTLLGICDRQPEKEDECLKRLDAHIRMFYESVNTGERGNKRKGDKRKYHGVSLFY